MIALTEKERAALRPPESLTPSEWAKRWRIIADKDSAKPGPWRHDRTPYLVELMDAVAEPNLDMIVFRKAARVGGSEWTQNALGYWIDAAPGPTLLVYPSEDSAKERLVKYLHPLIRKTPRLKRHMTDRAWDFKKGEIELIPQRIYLGWSGSPQTLASRTIKYVILDETDKFPQFTGAEGSPISLAMRRTETYAAHGRKILVTSTPTNKGGPISQMFDACSDRRYYHVPCPHCGEFQTLDFAEGMRWPGRGATGEEDRRDLADRVEVEGLAWYECRENGCRIEDRHKAAMVRAGRWQSEGYPVGEAPVSRRRAYQISALYSTLGASWSSLAAEWIRAEGNLEREMEVVNQGLGLPLEDEVAHVGGEMLREKAQRGHRRGRVPTWAHTVVLLVDTQDRYFYWLLRAHGSNERSRQIGRGRCKAFSEIRDMLERPISWEDDADEREQLKPRAAVIDSGGSRTEAVYDWCRVDPNRRIPIKGHPGTTTPARPVMVSDLTVPSAKNRKHQGLRLYRIDTQLYKDRLARLIRADDEVWQLCDVDNEYVAHLTAWHKVAVRKGGALVERWELKSPGLRHDFGDLEVYSLASREILNLHKPVKTTGAADWYAERRTLRGRRRRR